MGRHVYFFEAFDPIHVGTGGYRLGRVDNSIVRDPWNQLPKIPGTSLSGAARHYAAQLYAKHAGNKYRYCAGQGQASEDVERPHCGECPVCYTFGYTQRQSYAGVVNLFDVHLLFFPVSTMLGPIWISTPRVLKEYEIECDSLEGDILKTFLKVPRLNLGWMLFTEIQQLQLSGESWDVVRNRLGERVAVVSEKHFTSVVNANLEVRTSVAINPKTGAAEERALFTYEAIPRATILACDIVTDYYRLDQFPPNDHAEKAGELNWNDPMNVVHSGLKQIEMLGIGGMGTRGFGRLRILHHWKEDDNDDKPKNSKS